MSSLLRAFPEDFAAHLEGTAATDPLLVPLITDIDDDGVVTYDERHARKRPDWTYADQRGVSRAAPGARRNRC